MNVKADVVLALVTTVDLAARRDQFLDMLRSLPSGVALAVVFRGATPPDEEIQAALPLRSMILRVPMAGLSVARNLGLDMLASSPGLEEAIVGFPDDDCMWAQTTGERVLSFFSSPEKRLLLGRYRPADADFNEARFPNLEIKLSPRNILHLAASITMFARLKDVLSLRFDESLGVGTPRPAAEDTEMCLALFRLCGSGTYSPAIEAFHAYQVSPILERRSVGLLIMWQYSLRFPSMGIAAVRTLLFLAKNGSLAPSMRYSAIGLGRAFVPRALLVRR